MVALTVIDALRLQVMCSAIPTSPAITGIVLLINTTSIYIVCFNMIGLEVIVSQAQSAFTLLHLRYRRKGLRSPVFNISRSFKCIHTIVTTRNCLQWSTQCTTFRESQKYDCLIGVPYYGLCRSVSTCTSRLFRVFHCVRHLPMQREGVTASILNTDGGPQSQHTIVTAPNCCLL